MREELPKRKNYTRLLRYGFHVYLAVFAIFLGFYLSIVDTSTKHKHLMDINSRTSETLKQLVKTKFFRIIRINIQNECPFWAQQKMCKSGGCTVCRCDDKDIPLQWQRPETTKRLDLWAPERALEPDVWHVQDLENDKGEYFDVDLNKEAYTAYNGSNIWHLIYKENCFSGDYDSMCHEQKFLYRIISGLHTSISTHLSYFYKDIPSGGAAWAMGTPQPTDQSSVYYLNEQLFMKKVGDWPQRTDNLYFLYSVLLGSINHISQKLSNYSIVSENIEQDLRAKIHLQKLLEQLKDFQLNSETQSFLGLAKPFLNGYQRYIHNISRIMDCVECQKCRLFGKMQTYGLGTAMKIMFGQPNLKRNELVALLNTLNKISMSVAINKTLVKSWKEVSYVYFMIYTWVGLCLFSFLWAALQIYTTMNSRVKNMFHHVFPKTAKID